MFRCGLTLCVGIGGTWWEVSLIEALWPNILLKLLAKESLPRVCGSEQLWNPQSLITCYLGVHAITSHTTIPILLRPRRTLKPRILPLRKLEGKSRLHQFS